MRKSHGFNVNVANLQSLLGAGITSLQVNDGVNGWRDLWRNGAPVSPAPTIADGLNWELRVNFNVGSTVALWTAAITAVASPVPTSGELSGDGKDAKSVSYSTSGTYNDSADFNMGPMPSANVSLRVKCWVTDYVNAGAPPDSSPTNW